MSSRAQHLWIAAASLAAAHSASASTLNQLASVQIVGNVPFDHQLQTAGKLGVHRVRLAAYWGSVEKPRGRYIWRSTDERIKSVLNAGMVPVIVLFGPNDGYPSPDREKAFPPAEGEALEGFARFAGATAARFGAGSSTTPILYEIWNEPNTRTFWKRAPNPEAYARMAEAACKAIKTASPNARVLALGMEGTPVKAPYRVPAYNIDIYREWAARAATPALMACADGISFHPYLDQPEMVLRDEPSLRSYLARVWKGKGPPLLVQSEVGYSIDAKRGRDANDQAALDLRALLIGAGLGRVTSLYQSVDGGSDPTKPDQSYGMVRSDGRYKPAGLAVQRLLHLIGQAQIEGVHADSSVSGLYRFAASNEGKPVEVVWYTGPATAAPSVPMSSYTSALDLVTGQPREIAGGHVKVGASPLLLRAP